MKPYNHIVKTMCIAVHGPQLVLHRRYFPVVHELCWHDDCEAHHGTFEIDMGGAPINLSAVEQPMWASSRRVKRQVETARRVAPLGAVWGAGS